MKHVFLYACLFVTLVGTLACAKRPPQDVAEVSDQHRHISSYLLGRVETYQGDLKAATESIQQSLAADPDNPYLQTELAILYADQGRLKEARNLVESVLAREPDLKRARLLSGQIASTEGRIDDALGEFRFVLKQDPDFHDIRLLVAELYLAKREYKKALAELHILTRRSPEYLKAYLYEGAIYSIHLNNYKKAIEAYKKILLYEPNNIETISTVAELHLKLGERDEAIRLLRDVQQLVPGDPTVRLKIALIYYAGKQYHKAATEFRELQKEHPESDKITYYLGIIYENTEQYEAAIAEFEKIDKDSPYFRDAQLHRALLHDKAGERKEAIDVLMVAVEVLPKEPVLYEYLAEFLREDRAWDDSIRILKRAIRKTEEKEKFYYSLGIIYDLADRFKDSIKAMRRVLKVNPDNPNALNFIGYLYAERGTNLDEAEELIRHAMEVKPNDGYITDSLGWVYYQKGDYQKALLYLEQASRLAQDEPTIIEHLGDVQAKLGDTKQSQDYYREALRLRETNTELYDSPDAVEKLRDKIN